PAAARSPIAIPFRTRPDGGVVRETCVEREAVGTTIGAPSTGVITRRLLTGVIVAVGAFVLAHQVAVRFAGADAALAIVIGAGAALAVAAAALGRTIAPLVATQADLQERYEAAKADALRDPLTTLGNHRAFHEEL